jgi:hypothetical protein
LNSFASLAVHLTLGGGEVQCQNSEALNAKQAAITIAAMYIGSSTHFRAVALEATETFVSHSAVLTAGH